MRGKSSSQRVRFWRCCRKRLERLLSVNQVRVVVLGLILLVLGFVLGWGFLWVIGLVLLVIGLILNMLGAMDRSVGARRWYW